MYVIWSNEHKAWRRPNSQGYTSLISQAGVYERQVALEVVDAATLGQWIERKPPNELAVAVADLPEAAQILLGQM